MYLKVKLLSSIYLTFVSCNISLRIRNCQYQRCDAFIYLSFNDKVGKKEFHERAELLFLCSFVNKPESSIQEISNITFQRFFDRNQLIYYLKLILYKFRIKEKLCHVLNPTTNFNTFEKRCQEIILEGNILVEKFKMEQDHVRNVNYSINITSALFDLNIYCI